jgi:hypothetical protein
MTGELTRGRAAFKGVQLIIIDEISLINLEQLWEINVKLKIACDDASRQEMLFGGFHVLLTGDKFQLPPETCPARAGSRSSMRKTRPKFTQSGRNHVIR